MKKPDLGLLPAIPVTKTTSPEILRVLAQGKKESKKPSNTSQIETTRRSQATVKNLDKASLNAIAKYSHSRIDMIDQIFDAHPDMELAAQTLVSSILSPNDLIRTNLFFNADVGILPTQVTFLLNSFLQKEIKQTYKLENDLYDIVKESYITKGAYVKLFIPAGKIKDIVDLSHASVESSVDSICSKVRSNDKVVNNALSGISVTNDPRALLVANDASVMMSSLDMITTEAIGDAVAIRKKNHVIQGLFDAASKKDTTATIDMTGYSNDANRGLVMRIPSESVIPLHFTNDVSKHFGYFILLDGKGTPILGSNGESESSDTKSMLSNLVSKAKSNIQKSISRAPTIPNSDDILKTAIDAKLTNSIKHNIGGAYISDDDKDTLFRVIFHRALKDMKTRLLYVPASQLSYYAFDFRENGTGKPILEGLSTISSLRTMLRFAKVSALIRNSIPNTEVDVTLDDNDPDAPKTMESIKAYVMNTRSLSLPIGLTRTADVVDWLHKYGFSFKFQHADLPDMTIDTNEKSTSHVVPDSDAEDELKRMMYMKMGLSPETVENTSDADFAATVVANNVLQAKRISRIQMKLNPMITKDVVRYARYDGYMNTQLKHILESNLKLIKKNMGDKFKEALDSKGVTDAELNDFLFEYYVNALEVTLPKVELAEDGSKEAFDNYKDSLDDYIEMFFSEDALPEEYAGALSGNIDVLQQAIKNSLLRRWMSENGYMEELATVFETNDTGEIDSSVLEEYNLYINNIANAMNDFTKLNEKVKKNAEPKEKVEEEETPTDTPTEENSDPADDTPPNDSEDAPAGDEPVDDGADL